MSVLRWQLLPSLGRPLLSLAGLLGAAAYADHYARDLGLPAETAAAPTAAAPGAAAAAAAPPDMFRALQQLLAGQRDSTSAAAVPLLVQQCAACVQRSADLLAAYGLLAEAAASISSTLSVEVAQVCVLCGRGVQSSLRWALSHHVLARHNPTLLPLPRQAADLLEGAAHRIVRLLVRQRWTLADLDALPWGVALPLRQVRRPGRVPLWWDGRSIWLG